MFPSSSRVKLNRVTLKDVVGLQLGPRRRRLLKPLKNVDLEKQDENLLSEIVYENGIASFPSGNEPVQTFRTHQMGPESVIDRPCSIPEGEPQESRAGTQKAQRKHSLQLYKEDDVDFKHDGPNDRDIVRNTHPIGLAGSEGCLRRAVGASHCGLCGKCKYISPQRKTLGEQGPKSTSPGSEPPTFEFNIKKENTVTEASKKIIIWIDEYPKVTLCDIAKNCDSCCHNSGCILPDVLKTKVVHCFNQDMRAGFRFGPHCLVHNKHKSEKSALVKNSERCPNVHYEKSICQSQSLTKHQKHLEEGTDSQVLTGHTTCRFHKSRTGKDSATCSASFLLGKHTNKGECRTDIWDKDSEEDPGPGSDLMGAEICGYKRIKLGNCVCDNSTVSSTAKENCITEKHSGVRGDPSKIDGTKMSSELLCQTNALEADEPESYTCQRVKPYVSKINISCARTYMSWPFLNSGLTVPAHAATIACSAGSVDQSARDNSDSSTVSQNQPGSSSNRVKNVLPSAPTENQDEDGESISSERKGKSHGDTSSHSDRKDTEIAPHFVQAKESLSGLQSDTASFYTPSQSGGEPGADPVSASSLPVNGPETNNSVSTPSSSTLGLSDWETAATFSPMSPPFTQGGWRSLSATPPSHPPSSHLLKKVKSVELKAVEDALFCCEDTLMTSWSSLHTSDSFCSAESSLLLPQDKHNTDEELLPDRNPPKLEPYNDTMPFKHSCAVACTDEQSSLCNSHKEHCAERDSTEIMLPPVLSPVSSPRGHVWRRSLLHQSSDCPAEETEEEQELNKDMSENKRLPACHAPQIVDGNYENSKNDLEHSNEELEGVSPSGTLPDSTQREPQSSPSDDDDLDDSTEEDQQDETDDEHNEEQGNRGSEQVPLDAKIKTSHISGVLTEPHSSPSSDEDERGQHSYSEEGTSPSQIEGIERDKIKVEAADDSQPGILDEFTAYEQDILLVDVIHDDPELFDNLPEQSLLKLGPTRAAEAPKRKPITVVKMVSARIDRASRECEQRVTPVTGGFHFDSLNTTEESNSRPWRPQCSTATAKMQNNSCLATNKQTRYVGLCDANNNHVNGLERSQPIHTMSPPHKISSLVNIGNGKWITNSSNVTDFRRQKFNTYCRQYFSESLSCGFKMCRFQHLPVEGDEKFCVETVIRFTKNPMCLQKAGAVFTGYYQKNPPGVYFSMPLLLALLWALLKAGMLSDVCSVLSVSLAHNIVPSHEFLLALFNCVREKGLVGFIPELIQLTYKMAAAGLELNLDCLDGVKNAPVFNPNSPVSVSGNHMLSTSVPSPEYLNLAHAIVETELCTKQEDWRRMGQVFKSICKCSQHPNQVERISGRIAIALLSEGKDKLSLPFAAFAETACQNDDEDKTLIKSFVGRIGVSLMLRYHKTHQWAKGRKVVEMLSMSKVSYSELKGLFGNEDGASRCCLVTVATELFLLSGSVEGALSTLRENKWFLHSCLWPCEPADLESRTRVLMRLAEKTSHRDTLEVLCNLPGIKEPNDLIDISTYNPLFNSHLHVCVDKQILTVASDTVDFMLSKNLAVDHSVLHILLHKLGKQNLWLKAREIFRHSLSVGYYPEVLAPTGLMALTVPCRLGEVELAITLEMFMTVNATGILHLPETTTSSLSITLKRTQSCESDYLSAGSRLLSAACIPQPKLIVHYTAVNSSQEQVFTLDISSARRWLRHNHLWANEVWTH